VEYTIVIPAYNEEERIQKPLSRLCSYILDNNIECEVLIAVNNSSDSTYKVVTSMQAKYPFLRAFNANFFTGKGGAVALGFKKSKGDLVGFVDADGASSPFQVFKLFKTLEDNPELEGVIASRYLPGSKTKGVSRGRFVYSRIFNLMTRFPFGLRYADTQCGLKVFRRKVAKDLASRISTVGWTFDLNLLLVARHRNYDILEVPTKWQDIDGSKLSFRKAAPGIVHELAKLFWLEIAEMVKGLKFRASGSVESGQRQILVLSDHSNIDELRKSELISVLSRSGYVKVFSRYAPNKSSNEYGDNFEIIRRGNRYTYPIWLLGYLLLFFAGRVSLVVSWKFDTFISSKLISLVFRFLNVVQIRDNSMTYRDKKYNRTKRNLKRLVDASMNVDTMVSKKFNSWDGAWIRVV